MAERQAICGAPHPCAGEPSRVAYLPSDKRVYGGGDSDFYCTLPADHEGHHRCPQVAWLHYWPENQSPRTWGSCLVDVPTALVQELAPA